MNIRWRLAILLIQLALLTYATYLVTGSAFTAQTWYGAGMLALIINPQILEPYYPRPGDVVGNALIGILLFLTADRTKAAQGWEFLLVGLVLSLIVGLAALVLGASRKEGALVGVGRAATVVSRVATSRNIYSAVFWLSILAAFPIGGISFWNLAGTWAFVTVLGMINWQSAWGSLSGGPVPCSAEGMVGPSVLLVSAASLPAPGTPIQLISGLHSTEGVVLNRIHRGSDVWGEVHIDDLTNCELFSRKAVITISEQRSSLRDVIGAVLAPSSDTQLQFVSTRPLETGTVVAVSCGPNSIFYQIRWAAIEDATIKGGAHQVVRAHSSQLGVFNPATLRLTRHRWVPTPGGAVFIPAPSELTGTPEANWLEVGPLVGTNIPIFIDCDTACQGHIAILGMTRMGKTTLALRLANHFAKNRRVTILDQTGEWVAKKGLPAYAGATEDIKIGLSVLEPKPGTTAADEALTYLRSWVKLAYAEYKKGTPLPRVLIIDEAHQFVPEPSGLGFNSAGRESAIAFGLLMMQVRKYGISIVLISQRTAVVAKSALSQCENLIAFKNVDQTGLEYLEAILGSDARKALPTLRHAEALVFGPAITSELTAGISVIQ